MSTLFQSYEEEYRDSVKSISEGLAALRATMDRDAAGYRAPPATGAGSRTQRIAQLVALLSSVMELLNNMEYESNDIPAAQRPALKERLADCRANVRVIEDEIGRVRSDSAAADRLDLIGAAPKREEENSANEDFDDEAAQHRQRMMQNTEKMKQASNTLTRAERLLNETEDTGTEALQNLRTQTETMHHIQGTTVDVNVEISETRKIINRMRRTMVKHKAILVGIIVVLLLLIFLAIYISVEKNNSMKNVEPQQSTKPMPPLPKLHPNDNGGIPSD